MAARAVASHDSDSRYVIGARHLEENVGAARLKLTGDQQLKLLSAAV
jgi:hypothetical protein